MHNNACNKPMAASGCLSPVENVHRSRSTQMFHTLCENQTLLQLLKIQNSPMDQLTNPSRVHTTSQVMVDPSAFSKTKTDKGSAHGHEQKITETLAWVKAENHQPLQEHMGATSQTKGAKTSTLSITTQKTTVNQTHWIDETATTRRWPHTSHEVTFKTLTDRLFWSFSPGGNSRRQPFSSIFPKNV